MTKKKRPIWIYGAWITAIIVIAVTAGSMSNGSLGPFAGFIKNLIGEMILEGYLGLSSDILYFTYPFSIVFIILVTILFYPSVIGFILWCIERKRFRLLATVIASIIIFFTLSIFHMGQLAISEKQCDPTMTYREQGLVMRSCISDYHPFTIPKYLYESDDLLTQQMFSGIVISNIEFEELKKHNGDFGYFCDINVGCSLKSFQCELNRNQPCRDCVELCRQQEKVATHVVDFLKSESFLGCLDQCKIQYQK